MDYKIVADSCCDLNEELEEKLDIETVPLTISIGKDTYIDDEALDTKELLKNMKASNDPPATACPSPEAFMNAYRDHENVFVVTISSALSGTYNSAVLAKNILLEELGNKFIHVFDSLSASIGETLVSLKISELIEAGHGNSSIVEKTNEYIKDMKTLFILESLDNLVKTGRITSFKGRIASLLSIKPIMGATDQGEINLVEQVRGSKRAFARLLALIGEKGEKLEQKILGIAHCNALERALEFKAEVEKRYNFKNIVIVGTAGISTVYANDGGIIIAF